MEPEDICPLTETMKRLAAQMDSLPSNVDDIILETTVKNEGTQQQ